MLLRDLFFTRSYEMELYRAIRAVAKASVVCEHVRKSLANISVSKDDKLVRDA